MPYGWQYIGSTSGRGLTVGVVQIVFFRLCVLFVQHGDGLFQFALGAAALAHQRPHGLCEVAAEDGVQTLKTP